MLISVIVPAYKKELTITEDIKRIWNVMEGSNYTFEVIVVVDGFLDKTFEIASNFCHENEGIGKNVQILGYEKNMGKGHAIRYGALKSKGDVVVFIDAGLEINAIGIQMLLEHMRWYDADVIVGSKRHPVSKVKVPFLRRIYSIGYHLIVKLLFGLKVKDTQAGLKAFKREVVDKVLPRLVVKQYAFDIEALAVAHRMGFRKIYEAPIELHWDETGTSFKKFMFLDPLIRSMLIDTLAVFYRMNVLKYYDDAREFNWEFDPTLVINAHINTGD